MDQLLVDRPGWLDWPWALRVLDQEVRVTGEEVRPAEGMVATACLVAEEPLVVTATGRGGHLAVTPPAPALGEFVTRRFHLDLDENAVDTALEKSTLAGLLERDGWVRRPAAAMFWSYCLVFLCGGAQTRPRPPAMSAHLLPPAWLVPVAACPAIACAVALGAVQRDRPPCPAAFAAPARSSVRIWTCVPVTQRHSPGGGMAHGRRGRRGTQTRPRSGGDWFLPGSGGLDEHTLRRCQMAAAACGCRRTRPIC